MTAIYCTVFYSLTFILIILCNMGIESADILFGLNIEIAQPILYITLFIIWILFYFAISKYYYPTSLVLKVLLKSLTFGMYNYEIKKIYDEEENLEEIYENVIDFKTRYEIFKK